MKKKPKPLELPTGFTCTCGTAHKFPPYVYAHFDERLIHTCDNCGAKHSILKGKSRLTDPGPQVKARKGKQ